MRTVSKQIVLSEEDAKSRDSEAKKSGRYYFVRRGTSGRAGENAASSDTSVQPDTLVLPRVWTGANARSVLLAVEELSLQPTSSKTVNIDFSRVEFIDSSGLGALIGLRKSIARKQLIARLINVNAHIRGLLETANFDRLFEIS